MTRATLVAMFVVSTALWVPQQSSDTISKELVALLFGGFYPGGEAMQINEGLPADFPPALLPDDARAVVSMSSGGFATVVAHVHRFAEADAARFEQRMAAGGFTKSSGYAPLRGLVADTAMPPSVFCHDDAYAFYLRSSRPAGGFWVRVTRIRAEGSLTPCASPQRPGMEMDLFADVDMPALEPPPGSRVRRGAGGGGGDDVREQRMRLETTLTAAGVVDHYAAQLTKHGWRLEARAAADGIAIVKYLVTSRTNEPMAATVGAVGMPDGDIDVNLRLMRNASRRR